MAYQIDPRQALPKKAASAISGNVVAIFSASTVDEVVPAASSMAAAQEPAGITIATAATFGDSVAVQYDGVAKCLAAASIGVGALTGVASDNGALGPIAASAGAWTVGRSQTAAAAGEFFSVLIRVQKVGS